MSHAGSGRGPVPNPTSSFWTAEPRLLDSHRSTPDLPETCDVLIVGAGFAGVATAYHLLKDNPKPPSIVLLEARSVCSGASGRNGGHVKPDTYFNVTKYANLFGLEAAAQLAAFEASHVHAIKDLVEAENIDCDFHLTRAIDVYLSPEHAKKTEEAYRALLKTSAVNLSDVGFVPKEDAERVSYWSPCTTPVSFYSNLAVIGFGGPRRPVLLHIHSRPLVASENDSSIASKASRTRPQSPNIHSRSVGFSNYGRREQVDCEH